MHPFKKRSGQQRVLIIGAAFSTLANIRWPLMREIQGAGHTVYALASDHDAKAETTLRERGIIPLFLPMSRAGMSPISDTWYCLRLAMLIRRQEIDLVLGYTHKPVIYSALAHAIAPGRDRRCYALITGLGYAFTDDESAGWRGLVVRKVLTGLYSISIGHLDGIIFQNPDDERDFLEAGLVTGRTPRLTVPGSGVDLVDFPSAPLQGSKPRFSLIARLLSYKGVREFAEAATLLKTRYKDAEFCLVGPFDPNPSGISQNEVANWESQGALHYEGATTDVRPMLQKTSVYVLPSYYREGVPRTVLEAMSTGRAVITADTPGCRETIIGAGPPDDMGVRRGLNGFLVPARSPGAVASAMARFCEDPQLAARMGQQARRMAERYFDVKSVNARMTEFMGLTGRESNEQVFRL